VIENLTSLTLRQPWWLLLLLVPLAMMAVRQLRPRSHQHLQRLTKFIDPRLWGWLLTQPQNPHRHSMPWPLWLAWGLIALAASGPYLNDRSETATARSIDIAVVIDISPSMAADDITPSRLARAKLELRDFTAQLKADRTALIAYSANAYKVLPLTADRDTLHHFSDALDTTLTRKRGSNLTQALELAMQLLMRSEQQGRAIVLLTDGESFDPQANLKVAQRLHKKQIPLLILGVGSNSGSTVPNEFGRRLQHQGEPVVSRLDATTLQRLATTSGGVYTPVRSDDSDWKFIFRELDKLEPLNHYRTAYQPQQFQLFPWLMGAAIFLFIFATVKQQRGSGALLMIPMLLLLFVPTPETQASAIFEHWSESQAYRALNEGRHAEAAYHYSEIKSYRGQLGYGVAAYRQQEWQVAAEAFERALQYADDDQQRAQAHYNRGNALSRLRQLDAAAAAFEAALKLQSNFSRAALNLNLINKARTQQGGVQKREIQPPLQSLQNASHDNAATQISAQLKQAGQQRPLPGNSEKNGMPTNNPASQQQPDESIDRQHQPSAQKSGAHPAINWNNARQQAEAINKKLGHQFMLQRFMSQEGEISLKAEEKPW